MSATERIELARCWYCENELDPDTAGNDGSAVDTVYFDGEPMHRSCRDAHMRERELTGHGGLDTDPQL